MIRIPYRISPINNQCLTACEHRTDNFAPEWKVKVGSAACDICSHQISNDNKSKIVECNYPRNKES